MPLRYIQTLSNTSYFTWVWQYIQATFQGVELAGTSYHDNWLPSKAQDNLPDLRETGWKTGNPQMIEGAETIRKIDAEKNSIEIESGTSILASIDP